MSLQVEDIDDFFDTYGWRYERQSEGVYRTGFEGDSGHHEIWLHITDAWIYFTINPFLRPPEGEEHGSQVLELLLRANHDVNLAKFAVDDYGDVLLTVEMPRRSFCYSHFADALTALSHYADLYKDLFESAAHTDGGLQ